VLITLLSAGVDPLAKAEARDDDEDDVLILGDVRCSPAVAMRLTTGLAEHKFDDTGKDVASPEP
jgi:hypothetical protein